LQAWGLVVALGAVVVGCTGWVTVVVTGRMPDSWSDYEVGALRYLWRTTAFVFAWTSRYPGFSVVAGHIDPGDQPARLYCARPLERNRLTAAARLVLSVPLLLAVGLLGVAAAGVVVAAWVTVLVVGRWPEGLRRFAVGYFRYLNRVLAYLLLVTDQYPPLAFES
jgi:hypothetical protein